MLAASAMTTRLPGSWPTRTRDDEGVERRGRSRAKKFEMKLGDKYDHPKRGTMTRATNGALYVHTDSGTLWVKEFGTPSDPPHYGWRTCVSGGIGGVPLPVLVTLAPFTVVAEVTGHETPQALAELERVARVLHVRLPRELEVLIRGLPEPEQDKFRHAIAAALLDAGVGSIGTRMDSVTAVGHSHWAIPAPQLTTVGQELSTVLATWLAGGPTVAITVAVTRAVWAVCVGAGTRTKLSPEQAVVLRVLKRAPKGEGWPLTEVVANLPDGLGLSETDVTTVLSELGGLTDVSGKPVTWKIHEQDQRYWTSGI